MPPLRLVPLGLVDVIKCSRLQVTAPAVAVGDDIAAVVVALIDRVGIESRGRDLRPFAGLLQGSSLRQTVLCPAKRPQGRTAPRQGSVGPEVGLGHVAAPIISQLRSQEFGFVGFGHGMADRVPAGFQALHIVGIVRHDLGELGVAPPGGQAGRRRFDEDPMALLLCTAGRVIAKGDPAGGDGRDRGYRQGHEHNCESSETSQVGHEGNVPTESKI